MSEWLLRFSSFHFAVKAEGMMVAAGMKARTIATPPALHSTCGLCLLFETDDLKAAMDIVHRGQISHSGLYVVNKQEGRRQYRRWGENDLLT